MAVDSVFDSSLRDDCHGSVDPRTHSHFSLIACVCCRCERARQGPRFRPRALHLRCHACLYSSGTIHMQFCVADDAHRRTSSVQNRWGTLGRVARTVETRSRRPSPSATTATRSSSAVARPANRCCSESTPSLPSVAPDCPRWWHALQSTWREP